MAAKRVPTELAKLARDGRVSATYAAQLWRSLAPQLDANGRLTALDYESFEMLCMAYGGMRACELQIAEEGETVLVYQERGDNQRLVKHPASAARNEHRRAFLDLSDRFGLNPKARGNLRAPTDDPAGSATGGMLD